MEEAARRASEDKREEAGIIDPGVVNRAVVGSELSSPTSFSHTLTDKGLVRQHAHYWKFRTGQVITKDGPPQTTSAWATLLQSLP